MRKIFMLLLLVVLDSSNASEQQSFYNKNNPIPMELLDSWDSIEENIIYFKRLWIGTLFSDIPHR